jgi:methionyl-tRNA formyltransferase
MRAVLLGSSQPAVVALRALRDAGIDVVGVGAHAGERDEAIGASLLVEAARLGLPTAEFAGRAAIAPFVRPLAPDVGFAVGFRYLLDDDALAVPRQGWLNIHSSLLPKYRGRAPVNWAILNGETELGATLHVIDAGIDSGDVVFQERFDLGEDEDVADALRKLDGCYERLIRRAAAGLADGDLPRRPLDVTGTAVWPRRTSEDGRIDWTAPADAVARLVRAVAPPYPGAFTTLASRRLTIARARAVAGTRLPPGTIAADGTVACGSGALAPERLLVNGQALDSLAPFAGAVCGD